MAYIFSFFSVYFKQYKHNYLQREKIINKQRTIRKQAITTRTKKKKKKKRNKEKNKKIKSNKKTQRGNTETTITTLNYLFHHPC